MIEKLRKEQYRRVLAHYKRGLKIKEIALLMGITRQWVYKLIHRGTLVK